MKTLMQKVFVGIAILVVILVVIFGKAIIEINKAENYQILQSAFSGKIRVQDVPGPYLQMFARKATFPRSFEIYFSKHVSDGGQGVLSGPIEVKFNGGGTAEISGTATLLMPIDSDKRIQLWREKKSVDNIKFGLVRQHLAESLIAAATIMIADDAYATRRSEFTQLAEQMFKNGIYATYAEEVNIKDLDGNLLSERVVKVKLVDGKPIIIKESPLKRFEFQFTQFSIKDMDFDDDTEKMIKDKKKVTQAKALAKQEADTAKQKALTAIEEGKAKVAKAEADALVEKKTAVVEAEKKKEVAVLDAQQQFEQAQFFRKKVEEESKAKKIQGEAEAYANKLKVQAGLTPQERAEFEVRKAQVVAEAVAKTVGPKVVFMGGSGKVGQGMDQLFQTMGANAAIDLINKIEDKVK